MVLEPTNLRLSVEPSVCVVVICPVPAFSVVNPRVYLIFTVCAKPSAIVGTLGVLPKCMPSLSSL